MKRVLRWVRRIVLGVLALAVLAIAIAIGAVHTDWGRNKIRAEIVDGLQAQFPGSTIASLAGSPFGTVVVRGITIMARDGKPLATIAELRVQAALRPLIHHHVVVEQIAVTGVRVYVRDQPAKPTPAVTVTAASEPSRWSISAPVITVGDARIELTTATGVEVIDQLAVAAAVDMPAGQPLAASASVTARWRGKPVSARALVAVDGPTIRVPLAAAQLADANVVATGVELTGTTAVSGSLRAYVPAGLVYALANTELPGDIEVTARAATGGAIMAAASVGTAHAEAVLVADLVARRARGIVFATVPDLAPFTHGERTGGGALAAALSGGLEQAHGVIVARGEADGTQGAAQIALAATLAHAEVVVSGAALDATATVHAVVDRTGDAWTLADATVLADARNTHGVRDAHATFTAHGPVWPAAQVVYAGRFDAHGYRDKQTAVDSVHGDVAGTATGARDQITVAYTGSVDATHVRAKTTTVVSAHADGSGSATRDHQQVSARASATGVTSGTTHVPSAEFAADATIDHGVIEVALGQHRVRTQDGATWTGSGGHVSVNDTAITVDRIRTGSGQSQVTASARIGRLDDSLTAKVTARDVALAMADKKLGGTVDADVDVARRRGAWRGTTSVRAHGVAMPDRPTVDATADVKLAGRTITVTSSVTNPTLGTTTVDVQVTGPRDITNVRAWQLLPRTAIDHATIGFAHVDAAPLGATGTLDGQLSLGGTTASGALHVRGVDTKAGPVDADVDLAPGDGGTIAIKASARTAGITPTTANATIALPARPFDPVAWKQLGRRALRGATIETGTVRIDQALLARFGRETPYHADVAATVTIGEGGATATVSADVRGLYGGKLTSPIDIDLDGGTDATGTHADVSARSSSVTVTVTAKTPVTLEYALDRKAPPPVPIDATITLPDIRARDLLGLLGETDVLAGIVGGTVTVGGTVAAPTVHAKLAARSLAMKATGITNKPPPTLDLLELDARYSKDHVDITLTGHEGVDRLLEISAAGDPSKPKSVTGSVQAANFDLAPLAAFGTGAVRAARGTLNAALKIRGVDRQTGSIRGQLAIKDVRFPLSPSLGTLRKGSLEVDFISRKLTVKFDGRVGAGGGNVNGTLTGDVVGGTPTTAHLEMAVRKVAPIGALQPQIDADITGNWANQGEQWTGSVAIKNAKVFVPPETGNDLLITGAPTDMVFVDKQQLARKGRKPPTKTWVSTKIALASTAIDIQDQDARIQITARGSLVIDIGDGIAMRGQIITTKGTAEVIGRRYRFEQGAITFDGLPDPRLDFRVVHDFKNLTLTVNVGGRASIPDVRLSGDPGTYTEGELWGFLLGAEPGDETSSQANQAVINGGLAVLSGRVGKKVSQYLPIRVDTINYEAETATSSKAVRFGRQLTENSYLVWRQRLAARPDENPGEAVFEYQFRPNIVFEGTIGERNKGGDFLWRKRW